MVQRALTSRYPRSSKAAPSDASKSKRSTWLIVCLLAVLSTICLLSATSLMAPAQAASNNNMLGIDNAKEETRVPIPDAFGRDTPRLTVQGFIAALAQNDDLLASNYLNLSNSDNAATMVRQFKQALDSGGRFLPDLQLSNTPEGNLTDQLPPNQEKVGTININDNSVPMILERRVSDKGMQYWQFSAETINAIPDVLVDSEPTLISKYSFESLEDEQIFGYQLADIAAAIILIIVIFFLTYVAVWLLYHLLRMSYPHVRGIPLPMPDRVILPLSVVIMSIILSEVMIYAGVTVTLREPINRITEVASWLAVTWLMLRIIDAIFTRAVNLSYRKNHTERVSILGLLRKVVKALLLILAVIVIFGNLGFDLTTGIAALGVGGLALALGAQKTIENLVGSVVVVADSPVRIGDYCKFGTYEGTVIDIGIRSSRVRTLNRTIVTVPNGDFSSMQIENFTSRDMFEFLHQLYIKRTADIEVVFEMVGDLNALLTDHELTNSEWNQANISQLRQDCYVIQLRAYCNAANIVEFYGMQDKLLVDILKLVSRYDVEHALPTQQLIVQQDDDASPYRSSNHHANDMMMDQPSETPMSSAHTDSMSDNKMPQDSAAIHNKIDDNHGDRVDKHKIDKSKKVRDAEVTDHDSDSALAALALAKQQFRRVAKIPTISIWNQTYK